MHPVTLVACVGPWGQYKILVRDLKNPPPFLHFKNAFLLPSKSEIGTILAPAPSLTTDDLRESLLVQKLCRACRFQQTGLGSASANPLLAHGSKRVKTLPPLAVKYEMPPASDRENVLIPNLSGPLIYLFAHPIGVKVGRVWTTPVLRTPIKQNVATIRS